MASRGNVTGPRSKWIVFTAAKRLNISMMDSENDLAARLDPGERILWSGQPKQGVRLQPQDALMIPFSLMWGGFALFWEAGVLGLVHLNTRAPQHQPPLFFALWGIPFVLIGLYMIFGRFFYDAALRSKTFYAVTNRRLIILKNLLSFNLVSFDLGSTSNLNLTERSDGSGDILFGTPGPMQWMAASGWPSSRAARVPGFYLVPDSRQVFSLMREAQDALRRS